MEEKAPELTTQLVAQNVTQGLFLLRISFPSKYVVRKASVLFFVPPKIMADGLNCM